METIVSNPALPVAFTPKAIEAIKNIQAQEQVPAGHALRVGVRGGGCSGMSYVLAFDAPTEQDTHYDLEGVPVIMDKRHGLYIAGMTIEFQDGLNARGFVFQNPNAQSTCGCGQSFS